MLRAGHRPRGPFGHSYGGTLITHAGVDERVAALVYIAALAPDETETSQNQQQKFPVTDVFSHIEVADGRIWLKPSGIGYFAGDLPETEQQVVWATQAAPVPDLFLQKVEGVAWKSKPSWYIVASEDRTVHPELNAPLRSAWAPRPSSCDPVTCQCFPNRKPCWMLSGRPQARCRRASDNDAQSNFNRWKRDRRKRSISFQGTLAARQCPL